MLQQIRDLPSYDEKAGEMLENLSDTSYSFHKEILSGKYEHRAKCIVFDRLTQKELHAIYGRNDLWIELDISEKILMSKKVTDPNWLWNIINDDEEITYYRLLAAKKIGDGKSIKMLSQKKVLELFTRINKFLLIVFMILLPWLYYEEYAWDSNAIFGFFNSNYATILVTYSFIFMCSIYAFTRNRLRLFLKEHNMSGRNNVPVDVILGLIAIILLFMVDQSLSLIFPIFSILSLLLVVILFARDEYLFLNNVEDLRDISYV